MDFHRFGVKESTARRRLNRFTNQRLTVSCSCSDVLTCLIFCFIEKTRGFILTDVKLQSSYAKKQQKNKQTKKKRPIKVSATG